MHRLMTSADDMVIICADQTAVEVQISLQYDLTCVTFSYLEWFQTNHLH